MNLAKGEKPYRLLKGVATSGSLNKATKALKMSSSVLARFEETMGLTLTERRTGGTSGGGCSLTPTGQWFIERYEQFRAEATEAFDELFRTHPADQRAFFSPSREKAVLIMALGEEPYRLLKAVETFGSLNKAARALKKCYPAAWLIINRFEKKVGVKLVEGKPRGCSLTPTGQRFVGRYKRSVRSS